MSREHRIYNALSHALKPDSFIIENESHQHNVPIGAETHFKLIIVSAAFHQLSRVERHRKVTKLLQNELATGLHALSLFLYTPEEAAKRTDDIPKSPKCRDGRRHDQV
jgi:BolA protein